MRDFGALERQLLAALKHDGARLLEQLLNDPDLPQPQPELEREEERAGYRDKAFLIQSGVDHAAAALPLQPLGRTRPLSAGQRLGLCGQLLSRGVAFELQGGRFGRQL